ASRNLSFGSAILREGMVRGHGLFGSRRGAGHGRQHHYALSWSPCGHISEGCDYHAPYPLRYHAQPSRRMTDAAAEPSLPGGAASSLRRAPRLATIIRLGGASVILAWAMTTPGFLSQLSIFALLNSVSFAGCVAIGMTFITLSGNIMSLALGA